jgi:hypothetical protein
MAKSMSSTKTPALNCRLFGYGAAAVLALIFLIPQNLFAQAKSRAGRTSNRTNTGTQSSHLRDGLTPAEREMVERAIEIVCLERLSDPKGSHPIDEMQARPSLPVRSPEAIAGAERAQRLLPEARSLVISALVELSHRYGFDKTAGYKRRLRQAINRVQSVNRIRPDMDSRDNASVFLRTPHTITFGTIFLVGLPSDEGMVSVLAHELLHIADGDQDGLQWLFRTLGNRASRLTALRIRGQRAEELACDLVGTMAARAFVAASPNYEPLPRRIARSVEHNCVEEDEGDEDHLSPRNTIRALLALDPSLTRELVSGRDERNPVKNVR